MLFEDTYLTIETPIQGFYKDKGSKFLSFAFPVISEVEIKTELAKLRKEHSGAHHHCYAYRLGADKRMFRTNDDGEPGNTAGKPIFAQIQSNDLTNILIVVVRYFGGTLLGVSGLINAYKQAASDVLLNSKIIEKTVKEIYEIHFDYLQMNDVMKIIKNDELIVLNQNFELKCELTFSVRKSNSSKVYEMFNKISNLEVKYLYSN